MILEKCKPKKKNKKGASDMGFVGVLIVVAITIIVGLILFQISAQQVGTVTNTAAIANLSLGTASNSTTVYLTGYQSISDVVIYNSTTGVVPSTNYTVTNKVVYNGALVVTVLPTALATYQGYEWFISGTAMPDTYLDDSAGRSIMGIIVIFLALAVLVVAMTPVGGKLKELVGM
jgi:magnesium-transporting ATPase (P-type)